MDYSRAVMERFRLRRHAAEPGERAPVQAGAGRSARGAAVELLVWPKSGRVGRLRYRVFGCPWLIAAAELLAERLEGEPLEALSQCSARGLAAALDAPPDRLGRLLLLEDAAGRCVGQLRCPAHGTA